MLSIPKLVGILSCGLLLCLGLSNAAQAEHSPSASDVMKTDSQSDRQGYQSDDARQKNVGDQKGSTRLEAAKTITGELVRIKDGKGGKEVRLHTDKTTETIGEIKKNDRIEAKMNDQNHALSIRLLPKTDGGHGNKEGRDSLSSKD